MQLWAVAAALAVLASTVAMSRIGVLPFSILSFAAKPKATVVVLDHEVPYGKGMWIYEPDKSDGGNANAIVTRAKAVGLSHIYVRTGSSWDGFYAAPFLDAILPAAHAAGIRVYGWDFPRLIDVQSDVNRALAAIDHIGPGGNRLDGFAADIETPSEGTAISADAATAYGDGLRAGVGAGYPLIACVPRPSPWTKSFYPYVEVVSQFDAIAPMVYWQNRDPATDVAGAIAVLAPLGKPILPVGQAYNGGPEGGPDRDPPKEQLVAFMNTAFSKGALGVSFWVWNHATTDQWSAIDQATAWELPTGRAASGAAAVFLQRVLGVLGQPVAQDGVVGPATKAAIAAVQRSFGLPETGHLDAATALSITGPKL